MAVMRKLEQPFGLLPLNLIQKMAHETQSARGGCDISRELILDRKFVSLDLARAKTLVPLADGKAAEVQEAHARAIDQSAHAPA